MKRIHNIFIILALAAATSCQFESSGDITPQSSEGKGGSMARFTIVNNYLYTVDKNKLNVFNIANAEMPEYKNNITLNFGVETIFPFNRNLFIGTTTGMYVFDISNPVDPRMQLFFNHVRSCDPVVSDGSYAYVTLNSANAGCGRMVNELQIIDIKNLQNAILVKQYPLTAPKGLAVRNDSLWICDNGLKLFDITSRQDPKLIQSFTGFHALDLILNKNLALVIGDNGFSQYKISKNTIQKISEINLGN